MRTQVNQLAEDLAKCLQTELKVELRGSWRHLEYHLVDCAGMCVSYSDIDCVCSDPNPYLEGEVLARVVENLGPLRLPVLKVSLRCRQEVDSLWIRPTEPALIAPFLGFWLCVSLLETFAPPVPGHQLSWRNYQTCKHILRMWRLAAIAKSNQVASWTDTVSYMAQHFDSRLSVTLLHLKLGTLDLRSDWTDLFQAHEWALSDHLGRGFPGVWSLVTAMRLPLVPGVNGGSVRSTDLLRFARRWSGAQRGSTEVLDRLKLKIDL